MKLKQNKFYVYEHWYNDQCFYVGSGKYRRAYDWRREGRRSKEWYDFCKKDYDNLVVKIIGEFDTRAEAIEFEKALTIYNDYILKMPLVNLGTGNSFYGKTNSMYGKNVKNYMDYDKWLLRNKKQGEKISGEKHPKAKKIIATNIISGEKICFNTKKNCAEYFKGQFSWLSIEKHVRGEKVIKIDNSEWRFSEMAGEKHCEC